MERVDEIINFVVKNKIFLHIKIRWNSSNHSITDKFHQEQIVRYTPSEEHRSECKDDLCHINARLEFINYDGSVINSKSFEEKEEHRKNCQDDLCDMNARMEVIDTKGSITHSKSFEDLRNVTNFRQKKCAVL